MDLPRWDPFRVIVALAERRAEVEHGADRARGGRRAADAHTPPPAIDVRESADGFLITIDVPSAEPGNVRLDVGDGVVQLHLDHIAAR